jgi:hypothetical protein
MPIFTSHEQKFEAFEWLPLDQWVADRLLNEAQNHGPMGFKRYCKVCDEFVVPTEGDEHVAEHVEYERERRRTRAEEGKAAGLEAARIARAIKAEEKKDTSLRPRPGESAEDTINRVVKAVKQISEPAPLPEGSFTIAQYAEGKGIDLITARKELLEKVAMGVFEPVGTVSTGKRGRPPVVYGKVIK